MYHQIGSYDHFFSKIPAVLDRPFQCGEATITLGDLQYTLPDLYPNEARLQKKTYRVSLSATLHVKGGKRFSIPNVVLCSFPLMLQSSRCWLNVPAREEAGESLYDGGGYFIIDGAEMAMPLRLVNASSVVQVQGRCARFRSIAIKRTKRENIVVAWPGIHVRVPLFIMMRALGIITDRDISAACRDRDLAACVHDARKIFTQQAALEYLRAHVNERTREGVVAVLKAQGAMYAMARTLGHMVHRLKYPTPPSLLTQRVVTAGAQFAAAFEAYVDRVDRRLKTVELNPDTLPVHFSGALDLAFEPLPRASYHAMVSFLRRCPAEIHATHYGALDPFDQELVAGAEITHGQASDVVACLEKFPYSRDGTDILINGVWVAATRDPHLVVKKVVGLRARQREINVRWDHAHETIYVYTDAGRIQRPIQREHGKDWLDTDELENTLAYPTGIFGIISSHLVYPDHNSLEANLVAVEAIKQSLGTYHTNPKSRMDEGTVAHYSLPLLETFPGPAYGETVMVAIMSTGFNGGDAIVFNQGSVDRGLFRLTKYSTKGQVDEVYPDGTPVKFREYCAVVEGDVFASRAGHKGVCSLILPEDNMPFTGGGFRPDIIINPHANLSAGQLMEMALGRVHLRQGTRGACVPFEDEPVVTGNAVMYSAATGTQYECSIFVGPVYYMRLSAGIPDPPEGVSAVARQPVGGCLVDEPDMASMVGHGAFRLLQDTVAQDLVEVVSENVKVRVPFAFNALRGELAAMNVSVQPIADVPVHFRQQASSSFAVMQRTTCLVQKRPPFRVVRTEAEVEVILKSSTRFSPTEYTPRFNKELWKCPVYRKLSGEAIRDTMKYMFNKVTAGVYVRICNNRIVNFNPLSNDAFVHDYTLPKAPWRPTNYGVTKKGPAFDLERLYDLLAATCQRHPVADCVAFLNVQDFPVLRANGEEPFPHLYASPQPSGDRFIPVLSACGQEGYADFPLPYLPAGTLPVLPWEKRKPVFFWRGLGSGLGGPETNPRVHISYRSEHSTFKNALDARIYKYPEREIVRNGEVFHSAPPSKVDPVPLDAQMGYRFAFNIEGGAAAKRFGQLLKYGFCVLHVQSKYHAWFEPFLRGGTVVGKLPEEVELYQYILLRHDLADLDETLSWCTEHDAACKRIAANAQSFADRFFTPCVVYEYMKDLLCSISAKVVPWVNRLKAPPTAPKCSPARNVFPTSLRTMVVVVPFRDAGDQNRQSQLGEFLAHYATLNVLVVEQADSLRFNRGILLNVGYDYLATACPEMDTFVLHDVDMLATPDMVQKYFGKDGKDVWLLGALIKDSVDGILRVSKQAFKDINGFPNHFFGWGGENIALLNRLGGRTLYCPNEEPTGTELMTENDIAAGALPSRKNPTMQEDLLLDTLISGENGLNSLAYEVISHEYLGPLHRKIRVALAPDSSLEQALNPVLEYPPTNDKPSKKLLDPAAKPVQVHLDTPEAKPLMVYQAEAKPVQVHLDTPEAKPVMVYQAEAKPVQVHLDTPEAKPVMVYQAEAKPVQVHLDTPEAKPVMVYQAAPEAKPVMVYQAAPETKPVMVYQAAPETKPVMVYLDQPTAPKNQPKPAKKLPLNMLSEASKTMLDPIPTIIKDVDVYEDKYKDEVPKLPGVETSDNKTIAYTP